MSYRIYIPDDSAALALGADDIANAIAQLHKNTISIYSSSAIAHAALFWAEPLLEVDTAQGRMAYGPVSLDDVASLCQAQFWSGAASPCAWAWWKRLII